MPIIGNVEGQYNVNSIKSSFYGIFLTDGNKSYKFKENAGYSGNERIRKSAFYEPYGSKYPIVLSNGELSYDIGSVNGDVIVMTNNEQLDRKATVDRLNSLKAFLSLPNAKILKDFNGNIWLVSLKDNISVSYYNEVGMGIASVNFNWAEIGNADSGKDLYRSSLIAADN